MASSAQPTSASYLALFARPHRATMFTSVMAVFIGSLDSLIISTALPTISQRLQGAELYAAALGAYMIANLVGLPMFGAMSDRAGPWRAFLVSACVFGGGSVIGGLAPSMYTVVFARAIQGFGAGGLFAVGYAAIGRQLPLHLQPHGFGLMSATWGTSSLLGPAVGALLIATLGWRWVFWFNLPLVLVILPAARSAFGGVATASTKAQPNNIRGPLLLGLMAAAALGAFSAPIVWAVPLSALALVSLAFFWKDERTSNRPVLLALRRPAGIAAGAVITACLTGVAYVVVQTYIPLFVQAGRGESVLVAGAILTCGSLAWTVGSMTAARLIRRGTRWLLAMGHFCLVSGTLLLMLGVGFRLPLLVLFAGFSIAGLGIGFLTPSLFTMSLSEAEPGAEGGATAGVQVLRALGNGLGAGVAGLVFRLAVPDGLFQLLGSADPVAAIRGANLAGLLDAALIHCWLAALLVSLASAAIVLRLPGVKPQAGANLSLGD